MNANELKDLTLEEQHLSEDDLDDLLCGLETPEALAHVAVCARCAELLEAERRSLASTVRAFNDATLGWAEAKSNTIPRDLPQRPSSFLVTRSRAWSMALALLVALTAGVLGLHNLHHDEVTASVAKPAVATANPIPASQSSPDQIAQDQIAKDDAMLRAIDTEVNQPEPSPITQYAMTRTHAAVQHRAPQQVMD